MAVDAVTRKMVTEWVGAGTANGVRPITPQAPSVSTHTVC